MLSYKGVFSPRRLTLPDAFRSQYAPETVRVSKVELAAVGRFFEQARRLRVTTDDHKTDGKIYQSKLGLEPYGGQVSTSTKIG